MVEIVREAQTMTIFWDLIKSTSLRCDSHFRQLAQRTQILSSGKTWFTPSSSHYPKETNDYSVMVCFYQNVPASMWSSLSFKCLSGHFISSSRVHALIFCYLWYAVIILEMWFRKWKSYMPNIWKQSTWLERNKGSRSPFFEV